MGGKNFDNNDDGFEVVTDRKRKPKKTTGKQ